MSPTSDFLVFVGRLHPLLVHLPIGFLVLLLAMEVAARFPRGKHLADCSGFVAGLTVPVAFAAAACGWLLSRGGDFDPTLLAWHRWTGLGLAAASALVFALRRLNARRAYRLALGATAGLLVIVGHLGGSLTHGRDYLTRHVPGILRTMLGVRAPPPVTTLATMPAVPLFAAVIQPILEKHCVACHGSEKSKGGLRLDGYEALVAGGEQGAVVKPGHSEGSPLVHRLLLPLSDDEHMPPEGRPQLTDADLRLIQWWVNTGASRDKTLAELDPPLDIRRALEARPVPVTGGGDPAR